MKDPIERKDAIKAIMQKPAIHGSEGSWYHADDIRDALEKVPSADRPQGEWIIDNKQKTCTCSECNIVWDFSDEDGSSNFCSYCGADMRERNRQ